MGKWNWLREFICMGWLEDPEWVAKWMVMLHLRCSRGFQLAIGTVTFLIKVLDMSESSGRNQFGEARQPAVTSVYDGFRPAHQSRPKTAETRSRCLRSGDKDACTSHAISGAHDVKAGLRESRRKIRCGVEDLSAERRSIPFAGSARQPVKTRRLYWAASARRRSLTPPCRHYRSGPISSQRLIALRRQGERKHSMSFCLSSGTTS